MAVNVFTLSFLVPSDLRFQSFSGFAVRGFFFDLIRGIDKSLAEDLHSRKEIAPYSLTPVEFLDGSKWRFAYKRVKGPAVGRIRIAIFDETILEVFREVILKKGLEEVRLLEKSYRLVEISFSSISFRDLVKGSKPVKRFSLTFRTPCYFRRKARTLPLLRQIYSEIPPELKKPFERALSSKIIRRELKHMSPYRAYPLPDPLSIFSNLSNTWLKFSNVDLKLDKFLTWVDLGGVALSGFPKCLKTLRLYEHPTTRKWQMGFVGRVYFSVPEDLYDEEQARKVDALLRFGELVNIGGNRTAGFGVINYLPKEFAE